ncbi:hypothetical protein V6N13_036581 [Hibiscus sabdariffa]|uniref:Uncharacterized protein n=1 Tax=Hibiscus sabdariffa TaxID=183260 RepID=A0ABR2S5Y1_9ROSI
MRDETPIPREQHEIKANKIKNHPWWPPILRIERNITHRLQLSREFEKEVTKGKSLKTSHNNLCKFWKPRNTGLPTTSKGGKESPGKGGPNPSEIHKHQYLGRDKSRVRVLE